MRPSPLLDASLAWAEHEAAGFEPLPPAQRPQLRARLFDALLISLAIAPLAGLIAIS